MGKRRRGPVYQQSTKTIGGPLGAIAVQKAIRNGKQDIALQKAKDGAPKEEVKDAIWEIAMTPAKRNLLHENTPGSYADLDGAIDDLATDLLIKHGWKPDSDPDNSDEE